MPRAALPAACVLVVACATVTTPPVDMHAPAAAPVAAALREPAPAAPPPTAGAIFNAATHRPLFEDRRARLVGDTLTIQIEETVSASQQSTTKLDRSGNVAGAVTASPIGGAGLLDRLRVGGNSSASTNGDGKTDTSNTFTGVITVTVVQVLPNGNLVVAGDKQIGVNQNVDVLRFSGVVNPVAIRGGNVVSSTQVADARMEQRGRGDVGRVQGMGWLTRFFLSVAPV